MSSYVDFFHPDGKRGQPIPAHRFRRSLFDEENDISTDKLLIATPILTHE
jgi:hypothetical protein